MAPPLLRARPEGDPDTSPLAFQARLDLRGEGFLGGFVSSASTTASAALMASDGTIAPHLAGAAAVLATVSSSLVTLPLIYQQTRHKALSRAVALITVAVALLGLGVLVFQQKLLQ